MIPHPVMSKLYSAEGILSESRLVLSNNMPESQQNANSRLSRKITQTLLTLKLQPISLDQI